MAFKKLCWFKIFVFVLLFLCSVQTALSTKCYLCTSLLDERCRTNPADLDVFDCLGLDKPSPLMKHILSFEGIKDDALSKFDGKYETQCATVNYIYKGVTNATDRGCLPKSITCEDLKQLPSKDFDIQLCETCQSDKCNSRQFDSISRI